MEAWDREALTRHRQAHYSVTLLDERDRPVRRLDGVVGGSLELSATTTLRGSGSLDLRDVGQEINWPRARVRIDYHINGGPSWGLGVWLLSAPTTSYTAGGRSWQVDLLSKLAILDAEAIPVSYSIPKGTNLVEHAQIIIAAAGEGLRVIATPSPATAAATMVWPAGNTRLRIVNDLLDAAGYWSVWCDGDGHYRLEPYVEPARREPVWAFQEGEQAIHLDEWSRDLDMGSIPNRIVCVGQGSADKPALVGVAENTTASSPYSWQARQRWITEVEEGVEGATVAELTATARRRLIARTAAKATLEIQHLPLPLSPNQVVEFMGGPVAVRASVRSIQYTLEPDALASTQLVEVIGL